jgi:hypothetical protein
MHSFRAFLAFLLQYQALYIPITDGTQRRSPVVMSYCVHKADLSTPYTEQKYAVMAQSHCIRCKSYFHHFAVLRGCYFGLSSI